MKREWPFLVDFCVNDQGEEHYIALGPDFPLSFFTGRIVSFGASCCFLKLVYINISEDLLLRCMKRLFLGLVGTCFLAPKCFLQNHFLFRFPRHFPLIFQPHVIEHYLRHFSNPEFLR